MAGLRSILCGSRPIAWWKEAAAAAFPPERESDEHRKCAALRRRQRLKGGRGASILCLYHECITNTKHITPELLFRPRDWTSPSSCSFLAAIQRAINQSDVGESISGIPPGWRPVSFLLFLSLPLMAAAVRSIPKIIFSLFFAPSLPALFVVYWIMVGTIMRFPRALSSGMKLYQETDERWRRSCYAGPQRLLPGTMRPN